jgi:hypothetical protein
VPRVQIEVAGHVVEVDSAKDDLDAVAAKALELFTATKDPDLQRGFPATGFATELHPDR